MTMRELTVRILFDAPTNAALTDALNEWLGDPAGSVVDWEYRDEKERADLDRANYSEFQGF